ncbi:hypothetical protein AAY473_023744, partial [Plecturocebus cupreus]
MGFLHVGQSGLKLLAASDPPASASQSSGITGAKESTEKHLGDSQPNGADFYPHTLRHIAKDLFTGITFTQSVTQGLILSCKLECSDTVTAHCSLNLLASSNPPPELPKDRVSLVLNFGPQAVFLPQPLGKEFRHVAQAGLELLSSSDPAALASQSAGIT